jgi:hypothetical protein
MVLDMIGKLAFEENFIALLGDNIEATAGRSSNVPRHGGGHPAAAGARGLRLPALMYLYIHPVYVLISKILSSILNFSAFIHPLYHHLSTLSTVGPTYHFI